MSAQRECPHDATRPTWCSSDEGISFDADGFPLPDAFPRYIPAWAFPFAYADDEDDRDMPLSPRLVHTCIVATGRFAVRLSLLHGKPLSVAGTCAAQYFCCPQHHGRS